ncbi:MAG: hypothetical protein QOF88_5754 [Mycobacterium sp.]|nr:hypothetical protein [Mycobacterium sp.]
MEPQVTETEFTCKLITIRSKKSFAEVTSALEGLFRMVDLPKLASMTEARDHGQLGRSGGDHLPPGPLTGPAGSPDARWW